MPKPGIKSLLKHLMEYLDGDEKRWTYTVVELVEELKNEFVNQELS